MVMCEVVPLRLADSVTVAVDAVLPVPVRMTMPSDEAAAVGTRVMRVVWPLTTVVRTVVSSTGGRWVADAVE